MNHLVRNIKPIHDHINVITLPQSHFGENIKPKSIKLTDNSGDSTVTIKMMDLVTYMITIFYTVFGEINGSGSVVSNVFYDVGYYVLLILVQDIEILDWVMEQMDLK